MKSEIKELRKNIFVSSETGKLKKVLIHRPDEGIEKITPALALELLYDDIVYLPKMKEEHDIFTRALSFFTGKENLIEVQDLLKDILEIEDIKNELLDIVGKIENITSYTVKELNSLSSDILTKVLITGNLGDKNLFNPLPNLIFTRDIGVVIKDHLLVALASKKARSRESIISYFIFNYHPLFLDLSKNKKIINLNLLDEIYKSNGNSPASIEGGDVMMLGEDHLLVASSERTSEPAIKKLMDILFERNVLTRISFISLPRNRYCMHLDTVFTKIHNNECVGFEPLVMKENRMPVIHYAKGSKQVEKFSSIKSLLLNENNKMNIIPCGEGISPFAEREQWTDGCNLFAVKEGVCFTYDRNIKTNDALADHGYKLIKAIDFIDQFKSGSLTPGSVERTIITLPSSELSRARGGPHCMTMPLVRE